MYTRTRTNMSTYEYNQYINFKKAAPRKGAYSTVPRALEEVQHRYTKRDRTVNFLSQSSRTVAELLLVGYSRTVQYIRRRLEIARTVRYSPAGYCARHSRTHTTRTVDPVRSSPGPYEYEYSYGNRIRTIRSELYRDCTEHVLVLLYLLDCPILRTVQYSAAAADISQLRYGTVRNCPVISRTCNPVLSIPYDLAQLPRSLRVLVRYPYTYNTIRAVQGLEYEYSAICTVLVRSTYSTVYSVIYSYELQTLFVLG